jgi:hypothetical protein
MLERLRCKLGFHEMDVHRRADWSAYRTCARCGWHMEGAADGPLYGPDDRSAVKWWDPKQFR